MGVIGRLVLVAEDDARGTDAVDAKGKGSRVSEANDTLRREVSGKAEGGSVSSGLEEADAAENFSAMICKSYKLLQVGEELLETKDSGAQESRELEALGLEY